MFILEAMARTACVISTTVGGIPAVLEGDRGILVPPGDVDALAAALRIALGEDRRRAAIAALGNARFRTDYSADAVFPRVERIWLDAARAYNRELLPGR